MNVSATGIGALVVTILNAVFPLIGFDVPEGGIENFVASATNVIGFGLLLYGQWRRKDTKAFIFKQ